MKTADTEEWRDVTGYEGIYQVSSHGRVKSLHRGERILTPSSARGDSFGYYLVSLSRGGVIVTRNVHRLVATAFHGEPNGRWVRHLDGDRFNNHVSNLAWGTPTENNRDTVAHGHHKWANLTHCTKGHELTPENFYSVGTERRCKICYRERGARQRAARRAA